MKLTVRHIRQRLFDLGKLPDRLARARYFRGHGVHSPFVYDLVRHVFMERRLPDADCALYVRLLSEGVAAGRALQLQNLYTHCACGSFAVDEGGADLSILTCALPEASTLEFVREAALRGTTVAILYPHADRQRERLCRTIVEVHTSTTVDKRAYLLLFNNCLPKQHFRI